jgi:hypothetical protein
MLLWAAALVVIANLGGAAPPLPHFECTRASGPVTIDGDGSDAAWQTAMKVDDFRLWETYRRPSTRTQLRLCYDDENLYVLFDCQDDDLYTLYDRRDAYLWESDAVELFLQPPVNNPWKLPIYYEFEVAPNNAFFDARMVNSGSGGFQRWANWNCDARVATKIRGTLNEWKDVDEGYTVEMAIPIEAFSEALCEEPLVGQTWKFLGVRADFGVRLEKEERSATGNVKDSPHYKEGYSTVTFK